MNTRLLYRSCGFEDGVPDSHPALFAIVNVQNNLDAVLFTAVAHVVNA